ncbi:hypothetical protein M2282_004530 [Variovorax boronicumulans]|uniref:hypothetical protein n=1 Tax=Variovorax boronicumulans TaxID=436515 RepID=UPI0024740BFD|nr:hypothetical protein [Variovorax boronicumulans]MDH6169366.1 hypothetical protein [Variovorax boronicumulans]
MLTILQKANILSKVGFDVPARPDDDLSTNAVTGSAAKPEGISQKAHDWAKAIETLYVAYVAARAAKSLRDSEEVRQNAMLQKLSSKAYA